MEALRSTETSETINQAKLRTEDWLCNSCIMVESDVIIIILIQNIICHLSTFFKTWLGLYLFTISLHYDGRLYTANLAAGCVQKLRWISEFISSVV